MSGPLDFDALVLGPCMESFGEPVTFMPARGAPVAINAVFTEKLVETRFVGGDEVIDTKTSLGCQASQFPAALPAHNDLMRIRGRLWRVMDVIEDGHGHIRCDVALRNDISASLPETPPVYANA